MTDAHQTMTCLGTEDCIPPKGPGSPLADMDAPGTMHYEGFTGFKRRDFPELPQKLEDLSNHGLPA